MSSLKKMSVVIADADSLSRHGLVVFLNAQARLRVAGDTGSVRAARDLCRREKPDLLIVDPALDGGAGLALIKELPHLAKTTRAVAFARADDAGSIGAALLAGALGYATRLEEKEELLKVLLAMEDGEEHLSPRAMAVIAHGLTNGAVQVANGARAGLTARQQEVFAMLGTGASTAEIAKKLGVSVKTAESHLEHIKGSLGVKSVAALRQAAAQATVGR